MPPKDYLNPLADADDFANSIANIDNYGVKNSSMMVQDDIEAFIHDANDSYIGHSFEHDEFLYDE